MQHNPISGVVKKHPLFFVPKNKNNYQTQEYPVRNVIAGNPVFLRGITILLDFGRKSVLTDNPFLPYYL